MMNSFLDRWSSGVRGPLLAALIAMIAGLPGVFALPPLDRDESRFAQATAQMLETRDFVKINYQDQPRDKKPVGIHWLQSASVSLLSGVEARQIWAYRIPSLLGAMLAAAACAAVLDTLARKQALVVDLGEVSYIDSSGIASLVEAYQKPAWAALSTGLTQAQINAILTQAGHHRLAGLKILTHQQALGVFRRYPGQRHGDRHEGDGYVRVRFLGQADIGRCSGQHGADQDGNHHPGPANGTINQAVHGRAPPWATGRTFTPSLR